MGDPLNETSGRLQDLVTAAELLDYSVLSVGLDRIVVQPIHTSSDLKITIESKSGYHLLVAQIRFVLADAGRFYYKRVAHGDT